MHKYAWQAPLPLAASAQADYFGGMDMQSTGADAPITTPVTIYRKDYTPPVWAVPSLHLDFALDLSATKVTNTMQVERRADGPLVLRGDGLIADEVRVDGVVVNDWAMQGDDLILPLSGDAHEVAITTTINPSTNTQLMGLYASNGMLCTQCEAEGFRRITFHPDRPDVLSRYSVHMAGDKAAFPVLLSNGDCVETGDLDGGRHYAKWVDPWPKPSYLFALVAGDLVAARDSFTSMSGRTVDLAIYVRAGDESRTGHAMQALKNSMAWDEAEYGREYDLDVFNIVAVSDFNMGAMENKGLNIFNTRYILADKETATDMDFDGVEGVVAHEYFHNWSGNRVTCRDWFQLSLKEGFTVLRDQQFSAAMGSAAVKRIEDVKMLRAAQFVEDAGPLAHPIRPESFMEISNFYTATIYNKGAEVIRMMRTLMGADAYRKGTDLYFDRHDGEAATCEDFVKAMEDGGGIDLSQFRLWYSTAGTPRVHVHITHDEAAGEAVLRFSQSIARNGGEHEPSNMVIPLRMALLDPETGAHDGEQLVVLTQDAEEFRFASARFPVLSLNRDFSAPIILTSNRPASDLAFLARHDDDPFARFEAMLQLMTDTLTAAVASGGVDQAAQQSVIDAVAACLSDTRLDDALKADIVRLPTEAFLGEQMAVIDPEAIHQQRKALEIAIGIALFSEWEVLVTRLSALPYEWSAQGKGGRKLLASALLYMVAGNNDAGAKAAYALYEAADNMTNRMTALQALRDLHSPLRDAALADFYQRFEGDALVIDKWFSLQAISLRDDTLQVIQTLAQHPAFTMSNPNRLRSLYMVLTANQRIFHDASGAGYDLIADVIIALDKANPQTAARMVPPLGRWRRFDENRAAKMRGALERIRDSGALSRDVSEQVLKSLN